MKAKKTRNESNTPKSPRAARGAKQSPPPEQPRTAFSEPASTLEVPWYAVPSLYLKGRDWRLNPLLTATELRADGESLGLVFAAPVRGQGLRMVTLSKKKHPELYEAFTNGLLLKNELDAPRPVHFHCFLDDPPSHLVPRFSPKPRRSPPQKLIVHPSFRFQAAVNSGERYRVSDYGLEQRTPLWKKERLLGGYPLAWVEDPGTGVMNAYWVRGRHFDVVSSLEPGQPVKGVSDPDILRTLEAAGILVTRDGMARREEAWRKHCEESARKFKEEGYAILRDVLHPFQLAALRRYYRDLVAEGHLPMGDGQVEQRYFMNNEHMAAYVNWQLNSLISRVVGVPTRPTISYFGHYVRGSELKKHVDTDTSIFGVSMLLDHTPEVDRDSTWPLYVHVGPKERPVATDLRIGDALVYKAYEVPHSRERLPEGWNSSSLFLFYGPESEKQTFNAL